jgi:hypothetical protein
MGAAHTEHMSQMRIIELRSGRLRITGFLESIWSEGLKISREKTI